MTFQARVEDYVGTISDTDALTTWLTAGARLITDMLPEHILNEYAETVSVTTGGLSLASYRVQKALKNGYEAPRVDSGFLAAVQDSNSLHYAISSSPVSVIYNQKIYIYPNGGEVLAMLYPSVSYSAESTVKFPTRMQHGFVLYAAIQAILSKSSSALVSVGDVSLPTVPDDPSIIFVDVTGETITLPSVPTYTKPTTTFDDTNLSAYINSSTTEDLDQANTEAVHQKTLLEKFQMDLYNELNEYNKELEIYKVQFQKAVEDTRMAYEAGVVTATKDFEALIADYQAKISKYQAEIQAYVSQITANVNLAQGYLALIDKLKAEFNEFLSNSFRSDG